MRNTRVNLDAIKLKKGNRLEFNLAASVVARLYAATERDTVLRLQDGKDITYLSEFRRAMAATKLRKFDFLVSNIPKLPFG